ncbi:hypothetical protein CEXT_799951 [Caerostris extrusa]|uniref:Secreted protein n=1 Tax=Caerostris extrusa TaxID=172846 RepID=A0AAV4YG69_CAEEX|nr:hypothetical protein CEXT_799951 [Caerostris extrusa]
MCKTSNLTTTLTIFASLAAQQLLTPSCRFHAEIAFPGENTPFTSCETRRVGAGRLLYQEMRSCFSFHLLQNRIHQP